MSPYQIKVLLHIYAIAEPLPNPNAPILPETLAHFVDMGWITRDDSPTGFRTTACGNAFVEKLCSTPPFPLEAALVADAVKQRNPR